MPRTIKNKKTRYATVRTLRKTILPMAALLVAFTAGFSFESWQTNKQERARELAALTEMGAASLNAYFLHFEGTLRLATQAALPARDESRLASHLFATLRAVYPELRDLAVEAAVPGTNRSTVAWNAAWDARTQPGSIHIDRPEWSPTSGRWLIPLRYPLRGADGTAAYAVQMALPLSAAYRLWKDAPLPAGSRLGVIRDDGYLMTLYPPPEGDLRSLYEHKRSHSPLYGDLMASRYPVRGTVEGAGSMDGRPRLWVYRRLENYPLTLYTSLPSRFLWSTWWQQVRYTYLLLCVAIVGGLLVYRWMLKRQSASESAREKADRRIRRLNAALAQRVAQLETSNRELEAFSYTVSHDLRGPLRVIHGFSERLATHQAAQLDEQGMHYVERIRLGAQRMGALVDGLLQLSRVSRSKVEMQPVDLTHEAHSLAQELQQDAPAREVAFTAQPGLVASGSPALLRDLLRNLLENAWKFTANRPGAAVDFGAEEQAGERVYFVRDNGVGFDMRYAAKLFSVFQRLHGPEYQGVGIGLATAARIVALHGGRIWAEAQKDAGATFYFTLSNTKNA